MTSKLEKETITRLELCSAIDEMLKNSPPELKRMGEFLKILVNDPELTDEDIEDVVKQAIKETGYKPPQLAQFAWENKQP